MKKLIALGLIASQSAFTSAFACSDIGPFHFQVVSLGEKTRSAVGKGTSKEVSMKLKFAGMVDADASRIQSDAPFISYTHGNEGRIWGLDVDLDTRLSSEYTMNEIKDFVKSYGGVDIPLTVDSMKAMSGVALYHAMYNTGKELGEPLAKIFGEKKALEILTAIEEKKAQAEEIGFARYERPAFLTSEALMKKIGYNTAAFCMSMAFGRDHYTNPDEGMRESLKNLPAYTLRASVVDQLAAEYTKTRPDKEISVLGGLLKCKLKPSESYKLEAPMVRCPAKIVQTGPVVRGISSSESASSNYRYIQIGEALNSVVCEHEGEQINLSEMPAADEGDDAQVALMNKLLGKVGENIEADKPFARAMKKVAAKDLFGKEYVENAAAVCDQQLTETKTHVGGGALSTSSQTSTSTNSDSSGAY